MRAIKPGVVVCAYGTGVSKPHHLLKMAGSHGRCGWWKCAPWNPDTCLNMWLWLDSGVRDPNMHAACAASAHVRVLHSYEMKGAKVVFGHAKQMLPGGSELLDVYFMR